MRPRLQPTKLWLSQIDAQDCMCCDIEMSADSKIYCDIRQCLYINVLLNTDPKKWYLFPGSFRQYDYGLANLYKYGSLNPPDYNLSIISSFVSLIVGRNDWLASPEVRKKPVGNVFLSTLTYVT